MSLDLVDLTASYASKKKGVCFSLPPVSFSLPSGHILCVSGPSGCGKSTLLRAMSGLIESKGELLFGGHPLTIGEVAYMGEIETLYKGKSVFGSLCFPMQVAKMKEAEMKERIFQISAELGFANLLTRKSKELSLGQKKIIEFAKCVLKSPEVMLLDEPFSSLDPEMKGTIWAYIKQMKRDLGTTFVIITHDDKEIEALGDYVYDFQLGRMTLKEGAL